jgi:hypothetical protein
MVTMENKERNWHNSKYIDKGNTCAQDTFFFCSEVYNPKKYFATTYTDYQDCIINKTLSDCGHEFATTGPTQAMGGKNPYLEAFKEDGKLINDYINNLEDYDPSTFTDDYDIILEKAKLKKDVEKNKKNMMIFGGALIVALIIIIKS